MSTRVVPVALMIHDTRRITRPLRRRRIIQISSLSTSFDGRIVSYHGGDG
ncbi:hypothetical protein BVRB_011900 [Beta vulgaris subsp. vulgaris]|uniref:Uncharacterized protein n=1 Tax=Beta vulgaris subsp. vulgaris TaxID=3555 RepID=A0A0J8B5R4_BETVV|nr:hypothetical protein BVRB_011900 [Beta vulgaris subsp. vulgaris]